MAPARGIVAGADARPEEGMPMSIERETHDYRARLELERMARARAIAERPRIVRMACGAVGHAELYAIPDGARVDWSGVAPWIIGADNEPIRCRRCADAGRRRGMRAVTVRGTHRPGVPCTARCIGARRPDCECSCAGANHGAAEYGA